MKKLVFSLVVVALGLVACNKNEAVLENTPAKHKAPAAKNIRVFNSLDEVSAEIDKTLSMSFEELVAYEATIGFNSFGKNADLAYNLVAENEDKYKNVADVQSAINNYSEYLQLIEDETGYTCATKLYDNSLRYIINENFMYQVNDNVVKVFENGEVTAPISNYEILLTLNENEIENLVAESQKAPAASNECTFLYEIDLWYFGQTIHLKVYDCYGLRTVTRKDTPYFLDMKMGRKFELKDVQRGSDGRDNKMWLRMKLKKYKYNNSTGEFIDKGSFNNTTWRKGIWNGVYWRKDRDVYLSFSAYFGNTYGITYSIDIIRYHWQTTAEYRVDFPDTDHKPYFEKTRGFIRSFSGSTTINCINLNLDNF